MLTRLSRALLRVFPAILLVVVGLLAALFQRRRSLRDGATTLIPIPANQTVRPARRRGASIAILAVLVGVGLILALAVGDRTPGRLASLDDEGKRPLAALSPTDMGAGRGDKSEQAAPGGSVAGLEPGGRGRATAPDGSDTNSLGFDTVRVEPNGELVVAGRAMPNSTVELMVNGKPTASVVADANGQFAIVPPALPAGNSEVGLRVTDGKGTVRQSRDSVVVAVSPSRDAKPLVALTSPDKPTVVLSQPSPSWTATHPVPLAKPSGQTIAGTGSLISQDSGKMAQGDSSRAPTAGNDTAHSSRTVNGGDAKSTASHQTMPDGTKPGSSESLQASRPEGAVVAGADDGSTKIVSVDAQEGGRLFVSGQAAVGSTVRLYLNDTLIAPARVGRDGIVRFTIGSGVKSGAYKVRLDQVDAASGKVRSRVEVPFSVPDVTRIAGTDRSLTAGSETPANGDGGTTAPPSASLPMAASPGTAQMPSHATDNSRGARDPNSVRLAVPPSMEAGRDPAKSEADPAVVFIPEVRTARIERGDSLWAISRRTYGEGDRYTAIYDANQDQIRDPDLIYPGQVFVLPSDDAVDTVRDEKRG